MFNRQTILDRLKAIQPELQAKYPVAHLWLFGSVARDEATESSDVDLLYEPAAHAWLVSEAAKLGVSLSGEVPAHA